MFTKEIFGQRLLKVRKQHRETQQDLADAVDIAKSHISAMEKGKGTTTLEKFALICEHYQVSADYLLGLNEGRMTGLTVDEFRIYEETHDGTWELWEGEPFMMPSESDIHQWLCLQVATQFHEYLKGKNCIPLMRMSMWASPEELNDTRDTSKDSIYKPDLLVYCSKAQNINSVIIKPQVVVEIWSVWNSLMERSAKQSLYQSLGIKELWLIDSIAQDFVILSFADSQPRKVQSGKLMKDKLNSALFPGLTVDLSGVLDTLDNQPGA